MSIKHDPPGHRSIQAEAEVPGSPEEVWEAIATGAGISSWFYPTDVEEQVGGTLRYHTDSQMDHVPAKVTGWDPPHRFRHEGRDCGADGPPTATEWTIEARAGGRCLVRVVHSLFASTDDWDDQLRSFEAGWPQALAILGLYLAHCRGQRATIVRAYGEMDGSVEETWSALSGALASGGLAPGDSWALPGSGSADLAGVLAENRPGGRQPCVLFQLDRPAPGIAAASAYKIAERATVVISIYLYGDDGPAAAARGEAAWKEWMGARFA